MIENYNLGNIRKKDNWQGMADSDGEFVAFKTPEHGIRAMAKTLQTYSATHNIKTIEGIIKRWAPEEENDTATYIKNVAQFTGFNPKQSLNLQDPDTLVKVIKAISRQENVGKDFYSDDVFYKGVAMAGFPQQGMLSNNVAQLDQETSSNNVDQVNAEAFVASDDFESEQTSMGQSYNPEDQVIQNFSFPAKAETIDVPSFVAPSTRPDELDSDVSFGLYKQAVAGGFQDALLGMPFIGEGNVLNKLIDAMDSYSPAKSEPDPNFDHVKQATQDGFGWASSLLESDNFLEYQDKLNGLIEHRKQKEIMKAAPYGTALGQIGGLGADPLTYIPLIGGIKNINRVAAISGGVYAQELNAERKAELVGDFRNPESTAFFTMVAGLTAGVVVDAFRSSRYSLEQRKEKVLSTTEETQDVAIEIVEAEARIQGELFEFETEQVAPKSVGASATDPATYNRELQGNAFVPTIFGKSMDFINPISRILSRSDNPAKELMLNIFEVAPKLLKNTEKFGYLATEAALETVSRRLHRSATGKVTNSTRTLYADMLKRMGEGKVRTFGAQMGLQPSVKAPTFLDFREQMAFRLRTGKDTGTPEINQAADVIRKELDQIADEIIDSGIVHDAQTRKILSRQEDLSLSDEAFIAKRVEANPDLDLGGNPAKIEEQIAKRKALLNLSDEEILSLRNANKADEIRSPANYIKQTRKNIKLEIDELEALGSVKGKEVSPDRTAKYLEKARENIKKEIEDLRIEIKNIRIGMAQKKKTYLNRVWRKDKIDANFAKFVRMIMKDTGLDVDNATAMARRLRDSKPYVHTLGESKTGTASPLHQRELNTINDHDYREFLENDAMNLFSMYSRTMRPDLELYKRYGSVDLESPNANSFFTPDNVGPIQEVRNSYASRINAAKTEKQRIALQKELDETLDDLFAMRDLMRGTYMIPADPDSMVSRGIRIAKNYNAMTMLTGAMAAAPDIGRLITANGLKKSMGSLFEVLYKNRKLYKMGKAEAQSVGESFEFWLNSRAAQMADLGDTYGFHNRFEKFTEGLSHANFMVNGMSMWNDFVKTSTSVVVSTKILKDVESIAKGTATKKQRERLASSGIGEVEAQSIYKMKDKWHRSDNNIFGQADSWDNQIAKEAFQNAISKEINTVIVTPGLGDRPLFMSNQYLSLIGQFKSFAFGSHMRVLTPMLQSMDRDTAVQLAMMVSIGAVVAEIRNNQNDSPEMSFNDYILQGTVRSGVTGIIMDADSFLASTLGVGIQSTFGQTIPPNERGILEAILGPSGRNVGQAAGIAGDLLTFNANAETYDKFKSLLPMSNIAHINQIFDTIGPE